MNKHYHFTKENIQSALIPKSIFRYPSLDRIIIKENNNEDIIYKWQSCEVSIYTGYNSLWKNKCDNKVNIHKIIDMLSKLDIKSIREFERVDKYTHRWNEVLIKIN